MKFKPFHDLWLGSAEYLYTPWMPLLTRMVSKHIAGDVNERCWWNRWREWRYDSYVGQLLATSFKYFLFERE